MEKKKKYHEFNDLEQKLHYSVPNMIACELSKLLLYSANCIVNQTNLSNEKQLNLLQRFRDAWKENRGKVEKEVLSAEDKWIDYLTKTKQKVPKKAGPEDIPKKLEGFRKNDRISLENVGVISDMLERDLEGFGVVSKTTPGKLLPAIKFDEKRQGLGFRDIDMRFQERINELLPAKIVLSGELQQQGACLGMYALDKVHTKCGEKVRMANGREVWRHERRDMCIAKISGGNWAVQKGSDVGVNDICFLRSRDADPAFLHLLVFGKGEFTRGIPVAWEEALDDVWHAAAGLKCAGIEEHTPVLSETADSTSQAAPASGGKSAEGGGVALQLNKPNEATGDTSHCKRKLEDEGEGADGNEGWYNRTTVDLIIGCLKCHTNPPGFLDCLEKYQGGQICGKMFKDAGIMRCLWIMGTFKEGPIKNRAVSLWKKWSDIEFDNGWYSTIAVSLLEGCLKLDNPDKFLESFEGFQDGKISKKVFIEGGIKDILCGFKKSKDSAIAHRAKDLRRKWKKEEVKRMAKKSRQ